MPADKSADKLGSRLGVGERLEILCPVLFANLAPRSKRRGIGDCRAVGRLA